jgi:hypothetical protein
VSSSIISTDPLNRQQKQTAIMKQIVKNNIRQQQSNKQDQKKAHQVFKKHYAKNSILKFVNIGKVYHTHPYPSRKFKATEINIIMRLLKEWIHHPLELGLVLRIL